MLVFGYYLARCGEPAPNGKCGPPSVLAANTWKEAYNYFFEAVGDGRTREQFQRSLKSARDTYDPLFDNGRVGWIDKFGVLRRQSPKFKKVIDEWQDRSDEELKTFVLALRAGLITNVLDETGSLPEELRMEGAERTVISVGYERDREARERALVSQGFTCKVCDFNFEEFYGEIGRGYIEVHHLIPLAEDGERATNPESDLAVLCANCHRMVHRKRGKCLPLDELRNRIRPKCT